MASARIKAATTAIADFEAKLVESNKLVAAELVLKAAAALAFSTWTETVKLLTAQGVDGAKAKADLATNLATATDGLAALNKAVTGPNTVAKKATVDAK